MSGNGGGMTSKGLRAFCCQITVNFEAGYKPPHLYFSFTSLTLYKSSSSFKKSKYFDSEVNF